MNGTRGLVNMNKRKYTFKENGNEDNFKDKCCATKESRKIMKNKHKRKPEDNRSQCFQTSLYQQLP